jgi:hypothetical protein
MKRKSSLKRCNEGCSKCACISYVNNTVVKLYSVHLTGTFRRRVYKYYADIHALQIIYKKKKMSYCEKESCYSVIPEVL